MSVGTMVRYKVVWLLHTDGPNKGSRYYCVLDLESGYHYGKWDIWNRNKAEVHCSRLNRIWAAM
jgi:hypothetical protein